MPAKYWSGLQDKLIREAEFIIENDVTSFFEVDTLSINLNEMKIRVKGTLNKTIAGRALDPEPVTYLLQADYSSGLIELHNIVQEVQLWKHASFLLLLLCCSPPILSYANTISAKTYYFEQNDSVVLPLSSVNTNRLVVKDDKIVNLYCPRVITRMWLYFLMVTTQDSALGLNNTAQISR